MATGKHKGKGRRSKFCCARGNPCKCPSANKYRDNCDRHWKHPNGRSELAFQAHHTLCVASVKQCIQKKRGLADVVRETRWCVNAKLNMIALPVWGHTVQWYASSKYGRKRPPFQNLPQHDWDHNGSDSYREELETDLDVVAKDLADSKKAHEKKAKELAGELNRMSGSYKRKLRARGKRNGGTHKQFQLERARDRGDRKAWCQPFSMSALASEKGYPAQDFQQLVREKVKRFAFG